MELVDTHAHLDDERLLPQLDQVVAAAQQAGVVAMIAVGTTANSSRNAVQLAVQYPCVFAAVGIQPNYCAEVRAGDWDQIVELARHAKVVALGETGLDRYWDDCPFEIQQDYFDRHLELSRTTGLPFIVHMRDCQDDVVTMLREARQQSPLRGVMHSFTGDRGGAEACLELGLHLSFAGMVTYKKSQELRDVAAAVPADRILIETDSPYLSPEPRRSVRPNQPALIVHTAECLALARGESLLDFARLTRQNSRMLFGI